MDQKLIRLVKLHGITHVFAFLMSGTITWYSATMEDSPTEQNVLKPAECNPYHMEWLLPYLLCAQGIVLLIGMTIRNHGYESLIFWTVPGIFGLEFLLLLRLSACAEPDALRILFVITYLALRFGYTTYGQYTLYQIFTDLELNRQEAVWITAIICEHGEGGQAALLPEKNDPALLPPPELFAMKSGENPRAILIAEPMATNATENPKELPRWE